MDERYRPDIRDGSRRALTRPPGRRRLLGGLVRAVQSARPGAREGSRRARGRDRAREGRHRREPTIAEAYGIRSIPAVKAFEAGRWSTSSSEQCPRRRWRPFSTGLSARAQQRSSSTSSTASGEFPEILGPLAEGDYERRPRVATRIGRRRRCRAPRADPRGDGLDLRGWTGPPPSARATEPSARHRALLKPSRRAASASIPRRSASTCRRRHSFVFSGRCFPACSSLESLVDAQPAPAAPRRR